MPPAPMNAGTAKAIFDMTWRYLYLWIKGGALHFEK